MRAKAIAVGRDLDRLLLGTDGSITDAQLIELFVGGKTNPPSLRLRLLSWPRAHGLRTCRLVLGDLHAAEDAFQATFLVLRGKRDTGISRAPFNWLYGVASRIARKARTGAESSERGTANLLFARRLRSMTQRHDDLRAGAQADRA